MVRNSGQGRALPLKDMNVSSEAITFQTELSEPDVSRVKNINYKIYIPFECYAALNKFA